MLPVPSSIACRAVVTAISAVVLTAGWADAWAQDKGIRMMLKVEIPVESGNESIKNGTMVPIFEDLMAKLKPEAAYFSQENGLRTAYFVYLVDETFDFTQVHEPLIQGLGARVYDLPALTWDDMSKSTGVLGKQ